jgi:hypothetical protein
MSKPKSRRSRPAGSSRGRLSNGLDVRVYDGPPLGPGMVVADPASVRAALERFDPDAPWKRTRDRIVPMLPRVRPFPGPDLELVRAMLPPGILVSFGIDVGPAVMFVGPPLLQQWEIDDRTLIEASLANVRRLADECDARDVLRDHITDVPVSILQTRLGVAASLILVPEHLERFFGRGPHLMLAPMRDLLLALPADVDREFAGWLADELEALDPNHLHLGGFLHERGSVTPEVIDEALARA